MKSVLITDSGIDKTSGGGVVSFNLLEALRSCSDVQYIFSSHEFENNKYKGIGALPVNPTAYGYSYSDVDKKFSPFLMDYLAYHLLPMDKKMDIVQTYGCPFGLTIEELKNVFECKVVADVAPHNIEISQGEHMKYAGKYPFIHLTDEMLWGLYSRNLRLADVVIVHSHSSAKYLKEKARLKEMPRVIPHGIYLPEEIPDYPEELKPGYLNALGWDKGWIYIVKAWMAMFHETGPFRERQEFIFAGRETRGFRVQDNYMHYFKILGEVENIIDFYKQVNVCVSASVTEGFGITCLPPDMNIVTDDGLNSISKIECGDYVLTHKGRFKAVTKLFKRNYSGEMVKIIPYGFYKPIKVTPEHPVLCIKRPKKKFQKPRPWTEQEPKWVKANEVEKGDCLIFPIPKKQVSVKEYDLKNLDSNILYNKTHVWYKMGYSPITNKHLKIRRHVRVNKEFCKLLGYYIAEGSVNKNEMSSIEFSLGNEPFFCYDIIKLMKKIFGVDATVIVRKNTTRVIFSGKILAKFFSELCGLGARNKKIPGEILYGDRELLKSTLKGIHIGDGHICKNVFVFTTASERLASDIKIGLLRTNHKSNIGLDKRNVSYSIRYNLVTKQNHNHSNKSWTTDEWIAYLVRDTTRMEYNGFVHNLEVDNDNSYTTEGFAVHNCLEAMAHGRPVIVSEGAGASELVHDGKDGFVVPIRDEKAITRKLTWFYDNPNEIKKMGEEARKTAEKYTWDAIKKQYVEIYKELV